MRYHFLVLQLLLLGRTVSALSDHVVFESQISPVAGHNKVDNDIRLERRGGGGGSPKRKASPSPSSLSRDKQQKPNPPNVQQKSPSTTRSDPRNPALGRASSSSMQGIETPGQQAVAAKPTRRFQRSPESEARRKQELRDKKRQKFQEMSPEAKADFNANRRIRDRATRQRKRLEQQASLNTGQKSSGAAGGRTTTPGPASTRRQNNIPAGFGMNPSPGRAINPHQLGQHTPLHVPKYRDQSDHHRAVADLRKPEQRLIAAHGGGRLTRSMVTPEMAKAINEPSSPSSSERSSTPGVRGQPRGNNPAQRGNPTRMAPPPDRSGGTRNPPTNSPSRSPAPNTQTRGRQPMSNAPGQTQGPVSAPQNQGNIQNQAAGAHVPVQGSGVPHNALSQILNMDGSAQNVGASNQAPPAIGRAPSGSFFYRPHRLPAPPPSPQLGGPALPAHLPISHMDQDALRPVTLEQPLPPAKPQLRPPSLPASLPAGPPASLPANLPASPPASLPFNLPDPMALRTATLSPPPLDTLLSESTPWS